MSKQTIVTVAALALVLGACSESKSGDKPATSAGKTSDKTSDKTSGKTDKSNVPAQPSSGTTGPGSWKRITKSDMYKRAIGAVVHAGALYHAVADGTFYRTDLATGKIATVSRKPDFGSIRWLMDAGTTMLSLEKDGTVYKISPDASRQAVGKRGNYKDTIAAAVADGNLYTIERDGRFFITNLQTMNWTSLKKADYANTRYMLATNGHVVTVERDGSAFKVVPAKGQWWSLGPNELWRGTRAAAFHGGTLYRVGGDGRLRQVEMKKGVNTPVGKPDFQHVVWMGSDGSSLITLEKDGSLYRVQTK